LHQASLLTPYVSLLQDHPYILKMYEIIDDPQEHTLYLVLELASHGNLMRKVEKKEMTEETMRKYFRQLILALEYCHKVLNILHRDIKPENILIDNNDNIKLADFGVSLQLS